MIGDVDGGAHWWRLPGPDRFVAAAVADLRNGRNVLLRLPRHADSGLRDAVSAHVRADQLSRWTSLDARDCACDTLANLAMCLHDQLGYRPPTGLLPGPAALAAAIPDGSVVWIDRVDENRWPIWARFLSQFQHACHARDEDRRGLFCVPLVGPLHAEPESDTALAVHSWGGSLTRLDTMLFLDRLLPEIFSSRVLREVVLAVATELGGTDPVLSARLAAEGVRLLDDPTPALRERAFELEWKTDSLKSATWYDGVFERIDGDERPHSAALAAAGEVDAVWRRVWHGQVRVLYPFIEDQRVRLLPEVERFLQFPVSTIDGDVERAIDLEIGQLVFFLRRKQLPERLWQQLRLLKDMRHRLAHLEPVDLGVLESAAFQRLGTRY